MSGLRLNSNGEPVGCRWRTRRVHDEDRIERRFGYLPTLDEQRETLTALCAPPVSRTALVVDRLAYSGAGYADAGALRRLREQRRRDKRYRALQREQNAAYARQLAAQAAHNDRDAQRAQRQAKPASERSLAAEYMWWRYENERILKAVRELLAT